MRLATFATALLPSLAASALVPAEPQHQQYQQPPASTQAIATPAASPDSRIIAPTPLPEANNNNNIKNVEAQIQAQPPSADLHDDAAAPEEQAQASTQAQATPPTPQENAVLTAPPSALTTMIITNQADLDALPAELKREVIAQNPQGNTLAAAQYPSITSAWIETVLDSGVTTWVQVIYTQTFAKVVSQGDAPGVGAVGMGTLTGEVGVLRTEQAKGMGSLGRGGGFGGILGGGVLGLGGLVGGVVVLLGRI